MKKTFTFLIVLTVMLTGCAKTVKEVPTTSGSPSPASPAPVSASPEATPTPDAPANQTANPTPTPTPVPNENAHISEMYVDIIKSGDYFMKAKLRGESGISEFAVSVNGDSTAMETASDGALYNTVIKNGITYMIDHQNKIVITSSAEVASSASNMAGESLSADGITFTEAGTGNFNGENLKYDAYKTPAGGTMRFYFRETALAGIESIEGETTLLYIIEEISKGHREAMHVIPESYQLLDMASLGG